MPQYLSLREATEILPGRPHFNSVRRWMHEGCYGVKLRSVRFGGKRLTTAQWCDEFTREVTERNGSSLTDHFKAEAKLDEIGV